MNELKRLFGGRVFDPFRIFLVSLFCCCWFGFGCPFCATMLYIISKELVAGNISIGMVGSTFFSCFFISLILIEYYAISAVVSLIIMLGSSRLISSLSMALFVLLMPWVMSEDSQMYFLDIWLVFVVSLLFSLLSFILVFWINARRFCRVINVDSA